MTDWVQLKAEYDMWTHALEHLDAIRVLKGMSTNDKFKLQDKITDYRLDTLLTAIEALEDESARKPCSCGVCQECNWAMSQ